MFSPARCLSVFISVAAVLTAGVRADIPYHEAVDLTATVADAVPRVTLNWTTPSNAVSRIRSETDATAVQATFGTRALQTYTALYGLVWTGAQYVTAGTRGRIATTLDGLAWTPRMSGTSEHLFGLACDAGSGVMVAVGENGTLLTSPDAATWTARATGTTQTLEDAASSGNAWVAVGTVGVALRSTDGGAAWSSVSTGSSLDWNGITFGAGLFVAVGDGGTIRTSPDGVTWTARTSTVSAAIHDVVWNGSLFVAAGARELLSTTFRPVILTSPDGLTWTRRISALSSHHTFVSWSGTVFVAGGGSGSSVETSADGITWTARSTGVSAARRAAAWNGVNGIMIADGGAVSGSTNGGTTWARISALGGESITGLAWSGSRFVAVGPGGLVLSSADDRSWALQVSGTGAELRGVVWTGARFVALGDGGTVLTSADGVTWSTQAALAGFSPRGLSSDASGLVAVGLAGQIFTSTDGLAWTARISGVSTALNGVCRAGAQWLACGAGGVILTSPDGIAWTPRTSGTAVDLYAAASTGAVSLVCGNSGTILTSPDGAAWTARTCGTTERLGQAGWDGSALVVNRATYNTLRSTDGGATFTTIYNGVAQPSALLCLSDRTIVAGTSGTAAQMRVSATQRGHQVRRRVKGEAAWGPAIQLAAGATTYADTTAQAGVTYEYQVGRYYVYTSGSWEFREAMGYVMVPVKPPLADDRGRVVLIVDQTLSAALTAELEQYQRNLTADGWEVLRHDVPRRVVTPADTSAANYTARRAEIDLVRNLLRAAYLADPARTRAAVLIGGIAVPYAGLANFDGHTNHNGAMPTDSFYADVLGTWSDEATDTRIISSDLTTDTRHRNLPGDGKLDPTAAANGVRVTPSSSETVNSNRPPNALQLQVGRVDFSSMTLFPSPGVNETELTRRYLRKEREFRHRAGRYAALRPRAILNDTWGHDLVGTDILRASSACFGFGSIEEWPGNTYAAAMLSGNFTFGDFGGAGSFSAVGNVVASSDLGRARSNVVFNYAWGSYFFDFDVANNVMRGFLAATEDSLGLSCNWAFAQGVQWSPMGGGETLGYGWLGQMNQGRPGAMHGWYETAGSTADPEPFSSNLLGDPTLRLYFYEPPTTLRATPQAGGVQLDWSASPASGVLGYHVFRAATEAGAFTRISGGTATVLDPAGSPVASTSFTDTTASAGQSYTYLLRAVRLETTGSGKFYNLGTGIFTTTTVAPNALPNPSNLAAVPVLTTRVDVTWSDVGSGETGFEIQRRTPGGAWSTIGTAAADATSFQDSGPITPGSGREYRVRALGAVASAWSEVAPTFALASTLTLLDLLTYADIGAGTLQIPVTRPFGSIGAVSINYGSQNFSALTGIDFTTTSGTLNWADGDTATKFIPLTMLNRATPFIPRSFFLALTGASGGASVGANAGHTIVIQNAAKPNTGYFEDFGEIGTVYEAPVLTEDSGTFGSIVRSNDLIGTGAADSARVIYRELAGDATMTVRVTEQSAHTPPISGSGGWAGIDVRASLRTDDVRFGMYLKTATSSNGTGAAAEAVHRATINTAGVITAQIGTAPFAPYWLRVTRTGNSFVAQTSPDAATWTTVHSITLANMPANALWCLSHVSFTRFATPVAGANSVATMRSAGFANVSLQHADAPTGCTATPSGTSVQLAWTDASAAESGYRIEARRSTDAVWRTVGLTVASATTFTHSGLTPGETWLYRVSPIYAANALATTRTLFRDAFIATAGNPIVWQCYYQAAAVNRTAQLARTSGVNASPMWSWNDGSPRSNVVPESQNQSISATAMSTQMFLCYREDFPLTAAAHPRETLVLGLDYRDTDSTVRPIRFAIRVGAQWFVSDATFTPPAGTTTSPFTRFTLDLATAPLWRSLAFTPGSTLTLGALATPPAGDITAFGWFGDAGFSSGGVNWDNFTIAKPEPLAAQATASATLLTGFQTWAQSYGLPTDGTGLGAPLATPANDGIANLLKHGLGLIPHTPGWGGRYAAGEWIDAAAPGGPRYLAITYTRPEPAPIGISYAVETCADLAGWTNASTAEVGSNASGGLRTITIRDTLPIDANNTRRFIHLNVTAP